MTCNSLPIPFLQSRYNNTGTFVALLIKQTHGKIFVAYNGGFTHHLSKQKFPHPIIDFNVNKMFTVILFVYLG